MTVLDAVSLFSNCGAGDVGYAGAGFRFRVLAELVPHRLEVALLNHRSAEGVEGDLRLTLPTVVGRWRALRGSEPPALLAACPPCQGLSSARSHRGKGHDAKAGSRDPRNLLVQVVAEAVQSLRPRAVVVENVPAFLTRQVLHPKTAEPVSAAVLLIDALSEKYEVFPLLADLAHFGVPQVRKRSFLTFIRRGEAGLALLRQRSLVPYPSATHADRPITLRQALEDMGLPSLDASTPTSAVDPAQPLHAVPVWADRRYGMVAAIPPHSGRSAWENDQCEECGKVNVGDDDAVCPNCGRPLLRPVVVKDGVVRLVSGFRTSSYGRMHPDRPAATITTASGHVGSDKTIHPWENR